MDFVCRDPPSSKLIDEMYKQPKDGGRIEYIPENVSRWGYTAAEILSGAVNYQHIVHADDMDCSGLNASDMRGRG